MVILASADLHGDKDIYEWLVGAAISAEPDVMVLAGDLLGVSTASGTIEEAQQMNAYEILKIINQIDLCVLYLMGNDDAIELEPNGDSMRSINGVRIEIGDLNFVGYQYSLPFMGGIFEKSEDAIRNDLVSLFSLVDDHTVFVTHSPAYGTLDTGVFGLPAGSQAIGELIEHRKPLLHIHGHIHEEFGIWGRHFNVAAAGHKRAILIDTYTMDYQILYDESD